MEPAGQQSINEPVLMDVVIKRDPDQQVFELNPVPKPKRGKSRSWREQHLDADREH